MIAKLNAAFVAAINDPVVKDKLIQSGAIPVANTPAEFGQFLKDEFERWGKRGAREGASRSPADTFYFCGSASNLADRHCIAAALGAARAIAIKSVRSN